MPYYAAGATVAGAAMQYFGGQQTNAQNAALAVSQDQFSNFQLHETQNFNAQQAQLNRQYQTTMSDTAEQRRVADLKAAGLNPLLAATAGAASQPVGGQATASAPGPGGTPAMQNPAQGLGATLGGGVANAMQTASTIELQKAQAAKIASETPDKLPPGTTYDEDDQEGDSPQKGVTSHAAGPHALGNAQLANIMANTGVSMGMAQQVASNTNFIDTQSQNVSQDTQLKNINTALQGQNLAVLQATYTSLVKKAAGEANIAGGEGAQAAMRGDLMGGKYGTAITVLQQLLGLASSAASIATPLGRAAAGIRNQGPPPGAAIPTLQPPQD